MDKISNRLILSAVILFSVFCFSAGNAARAQNSAPDALIRDLYKTHDKGNGSIFDGKSRRLLDKYFDKTLADFIWKDLRSHSDEVGVLDFDPFYNAQEIQIEKFSVGKPRINKDKATVVVTLQNFDRKEVLSYRLVRRQTAWKISDIEYTDGTSLLGYFKEHEKNERSKS